MTAPRAPKADHPEDPPEQVTPLADSAAYSSGGTSASTGPMSVSGAAVDAKDGGWKATADAVDLSNVRSSRQ